MSILFILIVISPAIILADMEWKKEKEQSRWKCIILFVKWFYLITFLNFLLLYFRGWKEFSFEILSVQFFIKYMLSSILFTIVFGMIIIDITNRKYEKKQIGYKKERNILHIERNYQDDNIKCFLIFCVVLGHFLEWIGFNSLYCIIYSFHMPCFLFLTGHYAKYDRKKIIGNIVYPYCLFQVLYLIFQEVVIEKTEIKIQFTTPYWLLWYMVAMLFYYLLIPFIEEKRIQIQYKILGG